ncbi:MAG: OmpA family protein [Oceanococcaceae bacterium]
MLKTSALALSAGVAAAIFGSSALASANQTGWGVSGALTYTLIDDDAERPGQENGYGVRLGVSNALSSWLTMEALLGYQLFDFDQPGSSAQDEISLTVDYQFHVLPVLGKVHPYLVAGIGAVRTDDAAPSNLGSTDLHWNAGVGVDIPLASRWGLMADVKHRSIYWDERRSNIDPTEIMLALGVTYDLSPERKIEVAVDGDDDNDGVPNSLDRCPNTPAGAVVDAYGCEVRSEIGDADGDGVPDNMDRCPNTPPGTPVDGEGCPAPETVIIYFAFDSAELNGPARNALDIVADNLKERSFIVAVANGHADRTGPEAYNQALSERRAKSVADYLMSAGVPDTQIRTRAFGETRPATPGETPEQRARNRRVEINLIQE